MTGRLRVPLGVDLEGSLSEGAGQNIIHMEPLFSRGHIMGILNLDVRVAFISRI